VRYIRSYHHLPPSKAACISLAQKHIELPGVNNRHPARVLSQPELSNTTLPQQGSMCFEDGVWHIFTTVQGPVAQ
jgi:hypothetical protein